MKTILKKITLLCFVISMNSMYSFTTDNPKSNTFSLVKITQDKTVLIKKIKKRIVYLEKQRAKLKELRRWTPAKEKAFIKETGNLKKNLKKLGVQSEKKLDPAAIIKKLQKQLKYINNARVNKNAKQTWSKKDEAIYEKKAGKLLDSIIKLRMIKN